MSLICKICNRDFKSLHSLGLHISRGSCCDSLQNYYDRFILKDETEKSCFICDRPTKFRGLMGYAEYCSATCVSRSEKEKEKSIQTNIRKRGVKSHNQSDIVKKRKIQTCQKRYGVDNPYQSEEVQKKYQQTCQDRYGVDNPFELKEIQDKIKQTNLKKYGSEIPYQNSKVREKGIATCILKFGVDNHAKTFESRLKSREMLRERIENECGDKIRPMRGSGEKDCFDELEKHIPFLIDRDVSKIGYYPDGFIHECNLVIEFDEPEHQSREWYKKHDTRRDDDFRKIGCETFRIKFRDWENLNERWYIIEKLKRVINDRIK